MTRQQQQLELTLARTVYERSDKTRLDWTRFVSRVNRIRKEQVTA